MDPHLAQINVARMRHPLDHPAMAGFVRGLDPVNALADRAPGFVWRLQDESGNATGLNPFADPMIIVNMSVWASIEALFAFVYQTGHTVIMCQRKVWFEKPAEPHMALWWLPAGTLPSPLTTARRASCICARTGQAPSPSPSSNALHRPRSRPERKLMERILILDFGAQYTQLIARRIREAGVYCEILPCTVDDATVRSFGAKAVILSGGPASTTEADAPRAPEAVFALGVPVLGICYGEQTICAQLGGKVEIGHHREFGRAFIDVTGDCALFEGIFPVGDREQVWMSHGDKVVELPPGFRVVATSEGSPFAAIADDRRRIYGVQFHPEVVHTPRGHELLENFAHRVAGCARSWTMAAFREAAIERIRAQVGQGRVICGLSGGVDSAVTALLLHEAIRDQLVCILVDTGLLRAGEVPQIVDLFRSHSNIPLHVVDAADLFLDRLEGVTDPEDKRKIIGRTFIDVFEQEAERAGGADFLAQGTLYPDVIESVSFKGPSVTIKSHHNVGGLPERMNLGLVEPLRELFKDEVRALGRELGLPETFVGRHPFPGPGLAVRILGEITRERLEILRQADTIFLAEIRAAGLYDAIWQAFAVLLPVKTVGVMGDARTYEAVCALRAITSVDGMTADFFHFDMEFLGRVANRIVNEVRGINRVVYDVTSKPPGTIEWE